MAGARVASWVLLPADGKDAVKLRWEMDSEMNHYIYEGSIGYDNYAGACVGGIVPATSWKAHAKQGPDGLIPTDGSTTNKLREMNNKNEFPLQSVVRAVRDYISTFACTGRNCTLITSSALSGASSRTVLTRSQGMPQKANRKRCMHRHDLEIDCLHHHKCASCVKEAQHESCQLAKLCLNKLPPCTLAAKKPQCQDTDAVMTCKLCSLWWHARWCRYITNRGSLCSACLQSRVCSA
jgi:hypothetical protein